MNCRRPISGPVGSPVSKHRLPLQSLDTAPDSLEKTVAYGMNTSCESGIGCPDGFSLKTHQASRRGKPRSRVVWRRLATPYPDLNCRLRELLRRIYGGECSMLPTLTARDWKSPGRQDHPRLSASRGEPLPETFGERLSPEFCEWIMGFPAGWTELGPAATPSSPK